MANNEENQTVKNNHNRRRVFALAIPTNTNHSTISKNSEPRLSNCVDFENFKRNIFLTKKFATQYFGAYQRYKSVSAANFDNYSTIFQQGAATTVDPSSLLSSSKFAPGGTYPHAHGSDRSRVLNGSKFLLSAVNRQKLRSKRRTQVSVYKNRLQRDPVLSPILLNRWHYVIYNRNTRHRHPMRPWQLVRKDHTTRRVKNKPAIQKKRNRIPKEDRTSLSDDNFPLINKDTQILFRAKRHYSFGKIHPANATLFPNKEILSKRKLNVTNSSTINIKESLLPTTILPSISNFSEPHFTNLSNVAHEHIRVKRHRPKDTRLVKLYGRGSDHRRVIMGWGIVRYRLTQLEKRARAAAAAVKDHRGAHPWGSCGCTPGKRIVRIPESKSRKIGRRRRKFWEIYARTQAAGRRVPIF